MPCSNCSDCSDAESESSTVIYDHEPFETFQSRVLDLAISIWPDSTMADFHVERLMGGGFNRIIGLTRRRRQPPHGDVTQYIVRTPRFESGQVDNEAAALSFVTRTTTIVAPTVLTFDTTPNNPLGLPYMIQNRIPGTDLMSTFPTLHHSQKLKVARELGDAFLQMLRVRNDTVGRFVLGNEKDEVRIAPLFPMPPSNNDNNNISSAETASPCQWLLAIFSARHAESSFDAFWPEFKRMTQELDDAGWFNDLWYSLAHLDLAPRNILVDPPDTAEEEENNNIITAILDWDSAVSAPCFLSCYPPLWIWAWQDDEDEDERTANDDPGTEEGRELKKAFEDAAGPDYVRFAYATPYRLARRLVRFAIGGVGSNEHFKEAEEMLREWAEFCASEGLAEERENLAGQ